MVIILDYLFELFLKKNNLVFRLSIINLCLNKKKWYENNDSELIKNCIIWVLNGKEDIEKYDCVIIKIVY